MSKEFKAFNHGTGKIEIGLDYDKSLKVMRPVEIHLKEDGAIGDKPSFAILMVCNDTNAIGAIALKMLTEAMEGLGFLIKTK